MPTALAPRISRPLVVASLVAVTGLFVASAATGRWALAGAPLGFLLGFFLAKGDLCSTAAFGEILVMRDGRKLFGLWSAVVTCMVGFAALDAAGLVVIRPRPLSYASYLVGGAVFGVGMVLAGSCVSGTLYKCGVGHANSLVALLTIPFGVQLVDFGPLLPLRTTLAAHVIEGPGGAPVSLTTLTGIPHAVLAVLFAVLTIVLVLRARARRRPPPGAVRATPLPLLARILTKPWRPAAAGVAVGLLALPVWLTSAASGRDFALCVTYGVEEAPLLLAPDRVDPVWTPADLSSEAKPAGEGRRRVYVWLVLFAVCAIPGAHVAARLSGTARWYPRPPGQLAAALAGGLLVGIGAGLARGCMLGNGVTGTALMSVGMMLFAVAAAATNLLTTRWWVLGGGR